MPAKPADAKEKEIDIELDGMLLAGPAAKGMAGARGGPAALPAICLFGRFEILGRLAFGGMAEIFLARESTSVGAARHLVIKRVLPHVADDEKFVEMFLNEARLAIQLNHPSICHIYEFGELEGSYFIAMEWVNGVPLGKLIRRARKEKGIPIEVAVRIAAQVAEALQYAHRAKDALGRPMNIVHRDVTPHNVMIGYDGQVKLLDFGIAKAETQSSKTEAGTVKGKFSYMAPEQCLGREIDGRADVFALGICLWETLTARALFRRETQYETMHAVIHEETPSVRKYRPDVPESLEAIVMKALAKRVEERWASGAELQGALELWLAENRKIVNAATVAAVMEDLYEGEIQRGPLVDSTPFGSSFQRLSRPSLMPGLGSDGSSASVSALKAISRPDAIAADEIEEPRPRSRAPLIAALALFAVAGLGGAWLALRPALEIASTGESDPNAATDRVREGDEGTPSGDEGSNPNPEVAARGDENAVPNEAPPTVATLELVWAPADATVKIDGETIPGISPMQIHDLPAGAHQVEVTAPGYRPFAETIETVVGEVRSLDATLAALPRAPAAPPGTLSINTRPWSKVYVGARLLGTTPIADARVLSGAVRLRLVDRDGRTHTKTVRVPPGGSERVFYELGE